MNFLAKAALQCANFNPMRVLVLGLFCGFLLMAPDAQAKGYNEKLCPAEYPEHGLLSQQSPMCYQQCKPEYAGIGGVCVQVRASECLTQGNCVSTPSCKPGQENILGVCFNACPSTHNSSEVACTQKTPAGWSDAGAFFFRNTSKRVCTIFGCVNVPIYETRPKSILPRSTTGLANQCPAGQTLRLGLCVRNSLNAYVRGQVSSSAVAAIATDSFVKPVDGQPADEAFTVAVISDTQLPWDETSAQARAGKSTADSVLANSRAYNLNLVQSVNGLQNTLQASAAPLAFTVINGDLTAYFHPEQVSEFRAFYDKAFPWAYPHVLQSPVFLGLGNHDYENNLGSCLSFSWDKDRCAKNAINLIRGSVFAGYTKNMPAHTIESFDAGSLAYSWNRGRYHFVQLHNAPNYKIDRLKISASIEWLRADLARAKARGQSIIINMHKPALPDEFLQAIDGHPVVAIFAGHLHSTIGKIKDAQTPSGQTVPVFLSGSADQQSFLQVGFDPNKVRVTSMSSKGGQATPLGETLVLDASR
ncbi:metallophosphoesterase [Limnohabitans sp. Rim28]|uniref:metallophosphoesterase n=1 Tax=Limnohabitans sp. Rim28 TaxID=1100720 RepID=UPI000382CC1C|nr:metallophosphoesterase [Limnohabitans sp. Rim28]